MDTVAARYLSAAGAGALIGVCFFFGAAWPLSLIGIAILIALSVAARTKRAAFVYGTLCGSVLYGCLFGGIGASLFPFDWYGIGGFWLQVAVVGVSWLGASVVLGSSIGICAVLVRSLKTGSWFDLLLFPSLWILCEYLAAYIFYVYMLGPGSFFGPHFTLGYVGYFLAEDTLLLQFAWLGGVYLLSFSAVFFATILALLYRTREKRLALLGLGIVLVWVGGYAFMMFFTPEKGESQTESLSIAVISRYMEPTLVQTDAFVQKRYEELRDAVLPLRGIDMIVFPENAAFIRTLLQEENTEDFALIQKTGSTAQSPTLVDSSDAVSNGVFGSYVTFLSPQERHFGQKQFLLTFGEYVPYLYQFALELFGGERLTQRVVEARNYVPGKEIPSAWVRGALIAVRFCDEVMSPLLYRTQVQEGAQLLINISSLSWFRGSPFVYEHMQRVAKVRAVESSRYFVQSGNMAPAFVLDHHGRIVAETSSSAVDVLHMDVPLRTAMTPYTSLGGWVLMSGVLFVGASLVCMIRRRILRMCE